MASKDLVSDDLWQAIQPLLPPELPRHHGGPPRVPHRAALGGILFILRNGLRWRDLPRELGCGSGVTCWRRLRQWQDLGIWATVHQVVLNWLGDLDAIDWSRASVDSVSVRAKRGGEHTGPNPTDRGKRGSKYHFLVDRQGIPLAVQLTAANVHDSKLLEPLVDAVQPIRRPIGQPGRPRQRPAKLHADKGYDFPEKRRALRQRGITPPDCVARGGVQPTPGAAPLGGGTDAGVGSRFSQARGPLRPARRHGLGVPAPRLYAHLLALSRPRRGGSPLKPPLRAVGSHDPGPRV